VYSISAPTSISSAFGTTFTVTVSGSQAKIDPASLWVRFEFNDAADPNIDEVMWYQVVNGSATVTLGATPSNPTSQGGGTARVELWSLSGLRKDKLLAEQSIAVS
jgi:hypothetical protein